MTPLQLGGQGANPTNRRTRLAAIASVGSLLAGFACTGTISSKGAGAGPSTGAGAAASGTAGAGATTSNPGTGSTGMAGMMVATGAAGTMGTGMAGAGGTGVVVPPSACNGTISPGRSPLRRLNAREYDNTVRDLVATTKSYSATFPADNRGVGFSNNADSLLTDNLLAEGYQKAAEEMAAAAVMNLGALAPACNATTMGAATCAKSFIQAFGKKAFRRPLTDAEVTRYQTIFTTGSTGATYNDGISLVIEAMLQSPMFLYRVEIGTPTAANPAVASLTPFELASRMSYFLWQSKPDDTLIAAAEAGKLATSEDIATQANRMLQMQNDGSRQMVTQFHREWLYLTDVLLGDKPVSLFPDWTDALRTDLFTEADTFVNQVFWNDGKLGTLLTAPYSYMNSRVAKFYGLPAPAGTAFVQVNLDTTQRTGLLTSAAFLAANANPDQSSPIRRGRFVREQIMCETIQPPPNDLMIVVPPVTDGTTTRERFSAHHAQVLCASCHQMMDPVGFAFESFDAIGKWRTMDGGKTVDTSGEIKLANDPKLNGPINGAIDLVTKLGASPEVAGCVATQWFRWGTGRMEGPEDACSLETVGKEFTKASYDMRALPLAVMKTDAFRYRQVGGAP